MGELLAELEQRLDDPGAAGWLVRECALDQMAAENLLAYARDQRDATGVLPTADTLLAEAFRDELGDWRLVLHSPYGAAVNAAWAMVLAAWWRQQHGVEPDAIYGDDGLLLRFPSYGGPPPFELLQGVPAGNMEEMVAGELGPTALFVSHFRYNAGRALAGRVAHLDGPGETRWIAAEDVPLYKAAGFRDATAPIQAAGFADPTVSAQATGAASDAARAEVVRRHALFRGPFTSAELAGRYGWDLDAVQSCLAGLQGEGVLADGYFTAGADGRQWFETGLLQQARQATLAGLRCQAEARAPEDWARFLLEWHGLAPAPRARELGRPGRSRSGAGGPHALRAVLERLQGLYLPAEVWETEILPRRLGGYQTTWLDQLLAEGEAFWRGSGGGQGPGKVAFFLAEQASALLQPLEQAASVSQAPPVQARPTPGDLAPSGLTPPDLTEPEWRVHRVLKERGALFLGPVAMAAGLAPEETLQALWSLAWRGLICREVTEADSALVSWPDLLTTLKEMEAAGRVRRGYFVRGLSGLQFALPEAVEELRRISPPDDEPAVLSSACDPATVFGTILPLPEGGRLNRLPGQFLVSRRGRPLLLGEAGGRRLKPVAPLSPEERLAALAALPPLLQLPKSSGRRRLEVEWWDEVPAVQSEAAADLTRLGFERSPRRFVLWPPS